MSEKYYAPRLSDRHAAILDTYACMFEQRSSEMAKSLLIASLVQEEPDVSQIEEYKPNEGKYPFGIRLNGSYGLILKARAELAGVSVNRYARLVIADGLELAYELDDDLQGAVYLDRATRV